ncbi:J domain-containing protein [Verticiella sediminum]|uniref:J domain-containing protein n=1 Tax=Verticiella sediminum TaxID=1247510 RepID=A0A556B0H4_9BURK|nr:J domain-containing protein [Verticiella sediminum]
MRVHSHYENLKVSRDAPPAVIRAAYRALTQQYHPDRNPGDAKAQRVMGMLNRGYEVLSDPARRRAHDAWIREEEAALLRQHDEAVRRQALRRAQDEPPPAASRHGLRKGRVAGLAAVALLLVAAFVWAPGGSDAPAPKPRAAAAAASR